MMSRLQTNNLWSLEPKLPNSCTLHTRSGSLLKIKYKIDLSVVKKSTCWVTKQSLTHSKNNLESTDAVPSLQFCPGEICAKHGEGYWVCSREGCGPCQQCHDCAHLPITSRTCSPADRWFVILMPSILSPVHTSNNVEATFDFVAKNGNNVDRVLRWNFVLSTKSNVASTLLLLWTGL